MEKPSNFDPYQKPKINNQRKATVLDLSIKGYEALQLRKARAEALLDNQSDSTPKLEKLKKKKLETKDKQNVLKCETDFLYASHSQGSYVDPDVRMYIQQIRELPSFEDDTEAPLLTSLLDITSKKTLGNSGVETDASMNGNIEAPSAAGAAQTHPEIIYMNNTMVGNMGITSPVHKAYQDGELEPEPDPLCDKLYFPEIDNLNT